MLAKMFNTKRKATKEFADYVYKNPCDVIFICTHDRQNAEKIDFDIPTYYLNPKESVEMNILLKFFAERTESFVIYRSEYLSIPDVKDVINILGDNITFFGIFNDDVGEEYKSSYYLDRLYR